MLKKLKDFTVIPPHGGWSLLLNYTPLGITAPTLIVKLFNEAKIATMPMVGWGETAFKYVRFVFSNEPKERLIGIGEKIKRILR